MNIRSEFILRMAAIAVFLQPATLAAQDRSTVVQLSGGVFNVSKTPTQLEAGLEVRTPLPWWNLDVAVGVAATEEGSVWGYAGLRTDWNLGEKCVLSPGFGVALYEKGDGKDLGGAIEFRSSIGLDYRLTRKARVGIMYYHLSNAGYNELNPGANSAVLTYSVKLR